MSQEQTIARPNNVQAVWWLNPAVAFGVPSVLAGFAAYITGSNDYLYFWRTPKYFDLSALGLLFAAVIIFGCGCLFGAARRNNSGVRPPSADWKLAVPWRAVRLLFTISFILTVLAYVIWFAVGIKEWTEPETCFGYTPSSQRCKLRLTQGILQNVPGVTTGNSIWAHCNCTGGAAWNGNGLAHGQVAMPERVASRSG